MTWYMQKRLSVDTFKMTDEIIDNLRRGWYSDEYFNNTIRVLKARAEKKIPFGNKKNDLEGIVSIEDEINGDIIVEMQFFTRRKPFSVIAGVDEALAILKVATGYFDDYDNFVNTYDQLEIEAVYDGTIVSYDGDPMNVKPVIKVRGRYCDFGRLETPMLGVMSLPTRIATNTYNVLVAANGKPVLFFPARFDHYKIQAVGGYAYRVALERYNANNRKDLQPIFSTGEQNKWWGFGNAKGTISHASIACFLGNTAETMIGFAEEISIDTPRIALVDFHNDCVGTTLEVIDAMWERYFEAIRNNDFDEAVKFKLYGVRPDTSGNMRDVSVEPLNDKKLDNGVNLRLVRILRKAIDKHHLELLDRMDENDKKQYFELAKKYCEEVQITVTGGFNAEKIKAFEDASAPVDSYGVGSSLLSNSSSEGTNNDFTADIVRVKIKDSFYKLSKVGRTVCYNEDLKLVKND